jgi:probable biosynthetic protein (TIGR04098 family)
MCGHNALFVGQIGDWTWEAVTALCGVDVLRARDRSGAPTYLSFYYFRIRGGSRFHLRTPTFGDQLCVTTRLFDFGSESVLALHRITRRSADGPGGTIDPDDFYTSADDEALRVETFNRWVTRSDGRSNDSLVRSSPADFAHHRLPALPEAHSPRPAYHRARTRMTFRDEAAAHYRAADVLRLEYEIDPSRDINGVGLVYFASYFSMVDWALLRLWRRLGRPDASFLQRVVREHQLCFLGNAEPGRVVEIEVRRWVVETVDCSEAVDVVVRDGDRLLAVCTMHLLAGDEG